MWYGGAQSGFRRAGHGVEPILSWLLEQPRNMWRGLGWRVGNFNLVSKNMIFYSNFSTDIQVQVYSSAVPELFCKRGNGVVWYLFGIPAV